MTEKTISEQRALAQAAVDEAQKAVDAVDLNRAVAVAAIFERAAFKKIVEELRELADPADGTATQRSASSDVSAMVANLLVPFDNGLILAKQHVEALTNKLVPPPPPPPPVPND